MTTFTFDTAYIVAHLQNDANERVKLRIVDHLNAYACAIGVYLRRRGWRLLEADCATVQGDQSYRDRFERNERALDHDWDRQTCGDPDDDLSLAGHECPACGGHWFLRIRGRLFCMDCSDRAFDVGF